jgi:hypothetical protein
MRTPQFFGALVGGLLAFTGLAWTQTHDQTGAHPQAAKTYPYISRRHSDQAGLYIAATWGVDHLRVQRTSSGQLIRFTYRVVDVNKAKVLHAKKAEPHMVGLRTHAMLSVPTLENVGQLRQTEALQADKDYWVLFSNKGDLVRVGDRVDVVIGDFYASALTVE